MTLGHHVIVTRTSKVGMCTKQVMELKKMCLCLLQGAFRAVLHINWFLFVHHLVFCTFLVLAFQSQSIFVIKVDLIVSCFATYEFLLYASLISRRVHTLLRLFRPMLVVGIGLYLLTRLVQSAMLIGLFVLSYDSMQVSSKTKALYWVSMALCLVLVVLQSYTYVIYYSIWTSTNSKLMRQHNPPTNEASINCDQMASFQECHV